EDGIRDRNVTGVQTCALPIFARRRRTAPPPTSVPAPRSEHLLEQLEQGTAGIGQVHADHVEAHLTPSRRMLRQPLRRESAQSPTDRKSTRLNSSHVSISYAVF